MVEISVEIQGFSEKTVDIWCEATVPVEEVYPLGGKSLGKDDDNIFGSIIFSVWPGTQTSAFSDLKIA